MLSQIFIWIHGLRDLSEKAVNHFAMFNECGIALRQISACYFPSRGSRFYLIDLSRFHCFTHWISRTCKSSLLRSQELTTHLNTFTHQGD